MSRPGRPGAPELDGILVVDKPAGPTSHDVVAIVRRLTGVRRVGHGGTLDPFAAGVLPVFLGHATRMVEYHLSDEKAYRAAVVLGASSTTDDRDGELTPSDGPRPDRAAVEAALAAFRGTIEQVPPDHSAVHVGGRRAYELARHGRKPELRPRTVTIHALELVAWDEADPERPAATLDVRCSAGTYVRALARDLGAALGCGAYLGALTRTASGPFRVEDARPLDRVRELLANGAAATLLLPPDTGLDAYPRVAPSPEELTALAKGQVVRHRGGSLPEPGPGSLVRIVDGSGRVAAMARVEAGRLHPEKVFGAGPLTPMRLESIDDLPTGVPFVATLGVFDGVHLGHVQVLRMLAEAAADEAAVAVAITFDPHPETVVLGRAPALLCSLEDRCAMLEAAGVAIVVVQRFDEAFRQQSAEQFLDRLRSGRRMRGLVMSPESAFGHDREGTIDLVRRLAVQEGWRLVEIPMLEVDGERVSSGRIRQLLGEGRHAEAARLLGRPTAPPVRADDWWRPIT